MISFSVKLGVLIIEKLREHRKHREKTQNFVWSQQPEYYQSIGVFVFISCALVDFQK